MMGKQAAFGPFTPIVVLARSVVGEKQFNQIRGKVRGACLRLRTRFLTARGAGDYITLAGELVLT